MIFALILLFAVAIGFFVSPLVALVIFVVGALGFLVLYGMSGDGDETASADPGSRAARRFRRDARNTRIR
jgi:hypothetical protein